MQQNKNEKGIQFGIGLCDLRLIVLLRLHAFIVLSISQIQFRKTLLGVESNAASSLYILLLLLSLWSFYLQYSSTTFLPKIPFHNGP